MFLELRNRWESVIPEILQLLETECFLELLSYVDVQEEGAVLTNDVHYWGTNGLQSLNTSFSWGLYINCDEYIGLVCQGDGSCHHFED